MYLQSSPGNFTAYYLVVAVGSFQFVVIKNVASSIKMWSIINGKIGIILDGMYF